MRNFYFGATLVTLLSLLCGCSQRVEIVDSEIAATKSELSIGLPISISRTAMDENGKSSWSEGDSFVLWAQNRVGGFNIVEAEFKLMYYWQSYQSAVFTSTTNTINEGTYTYYAVSPMPESINNQKATYTLPNEQQGDTFNTAYDILVATPLKAEAIIPNKINNLGLDFQHKMHLLKMTIPQGGNPLNNPISRIVFTFPTVVAGNFTINVLDPSEAPKVNQGSRQLIINIPNGFDEGDHAWGIILPGNISGTVKYYAISTIGERTTERSFNVAKMFEGGHITPLSLTIPSPMSPTVLRFKVGKNNLGEAVQKVSIIDHNGKELKSFAANTNNIYDLEQHGIYEEGLFQTYTGRTFTVRFESAHAIVEQKVTIPSTIAKYEVNTLAAVDVPYLFFEDFSTMKSFERNDKKVDDERDAPGHLLNGYMGVDGWNAARFKCVAGQSIRINARCQSTVGYTHANGRLDTPNLACLKSGVNVKVNLHFDMGCHINSDYGTDNGVTFCMVGTHTKPTSSVLDGADETTPYIWEVIDDKANISDLYTSIAFTSGYLNGEYGGNDFSSTFPTYNTTIDNCTPSTRISWSVGTTKKSSEAKNAHYYIYLDNIKVSIAQ